MLNPLLNPLLTAAAPSPAAGDVTPRPGDDATMAALRLRAWAFADGTDWSRCDDQAVIAALQADPGPAPATASTPLFKFFGTAGAAAPAASLAPAAPRTRPAPVPEAPLSADDAAFSANIDVAAMVAALQTAARDGVPFCEECERARRAALAAA